MDRPSFVYSCPFTCLSTTSNIVFPSHGSKPSHSVLLSSQFLRRSTFYLRAPISSQVRALLLQRAFLLCTCLHASLLMLVAFPYRAKKEQGANAHISNREGSHPRQPTKGIGSQWARHYLRK